MAGHTYNSITFCTTYHHGVSNVILQTDIYLSILLPLIGDFFNFE